MTLIAIYLAFSLSGAAALIASTRELIEQLVVEYGQLRASKLGGEGPNNAIVNEKALRIFRYFEVFL